MLILCTGKHSTAYLPEIPSDGSVPIVHSSQVHDWDALKGKNVAVVGGGCSGLQYKMDLVDGPADRDIMVESAGVRVVIDPKSALFVTGSELDFSDDLQSGGFKVSNPNAVVTCSCGESFAA
jgi:iron-sulfur cluster assembly accessory protein